MIVYYVVNGRIPGTCRVAIYPNGLPKIDFVVGPVERVGRIPIRKDVEVRVNPNALVVERKTR